MSGANTPKPKPRPMNPADTRSKRSAQATGTADPPANGGAEGQGGNGSQTLRTVRIRTVRTGRGARILLLCLGFGAAGPLGAQTSEDVARGKAVFDNYCIHCHGTETHNSGATEMLEEKYAGAVPGALEDRTTLTTEFIREFVRGEIGMAAYRPTEIPDSDLDALTAYLMRNNP